MDGKLDRRLSRQIQGAGATELRRAKAEKREREAQREREFASGERLSYAPVIAEIAEAIDDKHIDEHLHPEDAAFRAREAFSPLWDNILIAHKKGVQLDFTPLTEIGVTEKGVAHLLRILHSLRESREYPNGPNHIA
ncbi:MAG: hypothetical protein JO019_01580 [Candidatus Kaiserbacteria bacterium]|nr:hypothetical protein [Candidatus Kaiserbacteria bacterium]